jgi:pantoate--beta-alanine ligase
LRIARTIAELDLDHSRRIGFVPTMGALHEGHASLMRAAANECEIAVASIFVNPLQFGPDEDFAQYPRDLDQDSEIAMANGIQVLFAPEPSEVYQRPKICTISVPEVADLWEGAHRPGHFEGVATVVAKLFNIVRPDVAFFGRKDFQQCAVIRRMVEDLNFPTRLSIEPTLREPDGLAMSSRNRYLTEEQRGLASEIYASLVTAKSQIHSGLAVDLALSQAKRHLEALGFDVDYFAYVDDANLAPLTEKSSDSTLITAAKIGNTRLIDNISV